eukprot:TRINITY_DN4724_c0_g1_i1.p1 TRINITY_DN4724_c0_g1~~TRINITY_DN4724_c0_g1_i1.p1  ORF type:complete len:213 (+),score=52.49 TRINITY_DN4724_c0_g1_i1:126-764(+)
MGVGADIKWKELIAKERKILVQYMKAHYNEDGTPKMEDPYDNDKVSPLHTMFRVPTCPEFQQSRGDATLRNFLDERDLPYSRKTPEAGKDGSAAGLLGASGSLPRLPTAQSLSGRSTGSQLRRLGTGASRASRSQGSVRSGYTGLSGLSSASLRSEVRRQVQEELQNIFGTKEGARPAGGQTDGQRLTSMLLKKAEEAKALQSRAAAAGTRR